MNIKRDAVLLLKRIPKGKVTTYKEIARSLGTTAYRAVGSAMACNEHPLEYPCYKVVNSDGRIGNYSAPGGQSTKIKKLVADGILVRDGKVIDLEKVLFRF